MLGRFLVRKRKFNFRLRFKVNSLLLFLNFNCAKRLNQVRNNYHTLKIKVLVESGLNVYILLILNFSNIINELKVIFNIKLLNHLVIS